MTRHLAFVGLALVLALQGLAAVNFGPAAWDEVYYIGPEQHAHVFPLARLVYGHGLALGRLVSVLGYGLWLVSMWRLTPSGSWRWLTVALVVGTAPAFSLGHLATPHVLALALGTLAATLRPWYAALALGLVAGSVHPLALLVAPALALAWLLGTQQRLSVARSGLVLAAFGATLGAEYLLRPVYWHHLVSGVPLAAILVTGVIHDGLNRLSRSQARYRVR